MRVVETQVFEQEIDGDGLIETVRFTPRGGGRAIAHLP
jgi:hypothetical protein